MRLKCAIIDDDTVFVKMMEYFFSQVNFMELTAHYPDAESAAFSMDAAKVDLLFLDMEMPGMNGIELLNTLPLRPPVIIISRKKEYGADAFDYDSIDYLHKPVSLSRFIKAANKARKFFEQTVQSERNKRENLYIRQDRMWIRIPVKEIHYIKADDNDVIIKLADKMYKTHTKLTDLFGTASAERVYAGASVLPGTFT
jgi:DNA-binding LytR/AlgR family response regulator